MRTNYAGGSGNRFGLLDSVLRAPIYMRLQAPVVSFTFSRVPDLQGSGIPVERDTPELAPEWSGKFASAKVIWGTWRLFASPDYKDFMGDYASPAEVPLLKPAPGVASLKCIMPEPPPPPPPGY